MPLDFTTDLRQPASVIDLFDRAAAAISESPVRDRSLIRLPARGRLLVTGDLHDNPSHLARIIRLARLNHSPDHHVVLHEMIHGERLINGVDLSHRMLARVAELIVRFPGQVHVVLANHELAQMTGKGVSKGAGNSVQLFNDGLEFVFGEDAEEVADAMRRFIRAMPLALRSQSGVLCAHSLPPPRLMNRFDLGVLERDLTDEDYVGPFGSAHLMVWGRQHTPEQIESLAQRWGINLFCLGHEHVDTGIEMKHPRVLVLNSDHERGVVLPIDLAGPPKAEDAMFMAIPLSSVAET
jgi:hypothetical protein